MGIMETIYLDDFLDNGILKEKYFRQLISETDWSKYKGKRVLIKGCASTPIPTWAYLIITAELAQNAKSIIYGDKSSIVKIYKRN